MRRVSVFLTAAAFFLALANSSPEAALDLPTLFPIKQLDKWGYIDRTGKVIVPPQYAAAGEFHQGRASVKVGDKFGFIDQTGKMVIPPQFDKVAKIFRRSGPGGNRQEIGLCRPQRKHGHLSPVH